jgi:hypothetical protein
MESQSTLLLIAGVLLAFAYGIYRLRSARAISVTDASGYPHQETSTRHYTFPARSSQRTVVLRLQIQLADGLLAWTLADPDGHERWHGTATGGRALDETRDFIPESGEWRLTLKLEKASGHYDARWTASGR